jgi:hypothetical protein
VVMSAQSAGPRRFQHHGDVRYDAAYHSRVRCARLQEQFRNMWVCAHTRQHSQYAVRIITCGMRNKNNTELRLMDLSHVRCAHVHDVPSDERALRHHPSSSSSAAAQWRDARVPSRQSCMCPSCCSLWVSA